MVAANLSTRKSRLYFIAVLLHWLSRWQDHCYRTLREFCSNYLWDPGGWNQVVASLNWFKLAEAAAVFQRLDNVWW